MNTFTKYSLAALIAALPVTAYAQDASPRNNDNQRSGQSQPQQGVRSTDRENDTQRSRQGNRQRDTRYNGNTTDNQNNQNKRSMQHKSGVRVSKYIGKSVYNHENQKIGDIEDLVMDGGYNRISYAVLSFGGFLGMGDKYFAIPWSSFEYRQGQDDRLFLNISEETLKNAPGFDKDAWPNAADASFRTQINNHYSSTRDARGGDANRQGSTTQSNRTSNNQNRMADRNNNDNNQSATNQRQSTGNQAQQRANTDDANRQDSTTQSNRTSDTQNRTGDRNRNNNNNNNNNNNQSATNQRQSTGNQAQQRSSTGDAARSNQATDTNAANRSRTTASRDDANRPMAGPTKDGLLWARRVSQVVDADIKNANDQDVGEIEDLIVEPETGRVSYAVIDLERDMRSAERYVAIPINKLTTDAQDEEFILRMSSNELRNAPSFNNGQWPDWSDDQFRTRVDRLSDAN